MLISLHNYMIPAVINLRPAAFNYHDYDFSNRFRQRPIITFLQLFRVFVTIVHFFKATLRPGVAEIIAPVGGPGKWHHEWGIKTEHNRETILWSFTDHFTWLMASLPGSPMGAIISATPGWLSVQIYCLCCTMYNQTEVLRPTLMPNFVEMRL